MTAPPPDPRQLELIYAWQPPTERECPRCGTTFTAKELAARCPRCSFRESAT